MPLVAILAQQQGAVAHAVKLAVSAFVRARNGIMSIRSR